MPNAIDFLYGQMCIFSLPDRKTKVLTANRNSRNTG